jgi:putative phosphonate metabolism protein
VMRVAVYYAPQPDDPLFAESTTWLGRDPESGAAAPQPDIPAIAEVTAEPRVYGFHATLKPPMRLQDHGQWPVVVKAATEIASSIAPFELPRLAVSDVHGFLALRETSFCAPLQALADACVARMDHLRAPLTDDEIARRRRARLTQQQDEMLLRWGYPYVFETWFFHMTVTRRLTAAEKQIFMPAAEAHFACAIEVPRSVVDICLFVQPAPGEPFVIEERLPLRG